MIQMGHSGGKALCAIPTTGWISHGDEHYNWVGRKHRTHAFDNRSVFCLGGQKSKVKMASRLLPSGGSGFGGGAPAHPGESRKASWRRHLT